MALVVGLGDGAWAMRAPNPNNPNLGLGLTTMR